ncbi:unnamed protein product [Acanthosepion pharaonis]|uniref:Uncharacterized protein n=1 Tax=Acanthosepion pharaonis TaxID=158019 RepID=A0A812CH50_ACAPH|nr:unnamed protein product [Sepia pharaonis]
MPLSARKATDVSSRYQLTRSGLSPDKITPTGSVVSTNPIYFFESSDMVFNFASPRLCFRKEILRRSFERILALLEAVATTSITNLYIKVYQPFCSAVEQDDSMWHEFPYAPHNRQECDTCTPHVFKIAGDAATSYAACMRNLKCTALRRHQSQPTDLNTLNTLLVEPSTPLSLVYNLQHSSLVLDLPKPLLPSSCHCILSPR